MQSEYIESSNNNTLEGISATTYPTHQHGSNDQHDSNPEISLPGVDSEATASSLTSNAAIGQSATGDPSTPAYESRDVASGVKDHEQDANDDASDAKLCISQNTTNQVAARIYHHNAILTTRLVDLPNGKSDLPLQTGKAY